jgi:HlyD family secretion protein
MKHDTADSPAAISQLLGRARRGDRRRRVKALLAVAATILLVVWGVATRLSSGPEKMSYQTAEVRRADLAVHVTATGTLQPVNQVDVGTEISGTVENVAVDFNDHVKRGQLLARLNTDQLTARLRQAEATLQLARASVEQAQATLIETRARSERLQAMASRSLASPDEVEAAQAAFARAAAGVGLAESQVTQAAAQVDADRTTLNKAEIRSPIDGIVLLRQVEVGQTVAASLQTPVLFTLAENLVQMELNVAVDEADVGQVSAGQSAVFTVDAFPGRNFPAVIDQVRYAPQTVQGVVTYETVLSVDNSDLALRPGMTATVEIVVGEYKNVLLVPNAALRFAPPASPVRDSGGGSLLSRLFPRPSRGPASAPREMGGEGARQQRVWILRDGQPLAVPIQTGASDGQMTEVTAGELQPGIALLVDVGRAAR